MKIIYVGFLLVIWMIVTLLLVISIFGLFLLLDDYGWWPDISKKLITIIKEDC